VFLQKVMTVATIIIRLIGAPTKSRHNGINLNRQRCSQRRSLSPPRMIYFIRVAALRSNKLAIIRIVKCGADRRSRKTLMRRGLVVMDLKRF
jgi:hypothetical protein